MATYRSNLLPHLLFLFLSAFHFSARSEVVQISYPHFSANDSAMRPYADVLYNDDHHSFIMNANSVATSTATCGLLLYEKADRRIQDVKSSFSTSFTFRVTTPVHPPVWDHGSIATRTDFGNRLVFGLGYALDDLWLVSWANQPGPCSTVPGYKNYLAFVFVTDFYYKKGEPSNNFIGIRYGEYIHDGGFGVGATHNLCGNDTHCSYFTNGGTFTAWIDMTPERTLQVRLVNGSFQEKPVAPLFEYPKVEMPPEMGEYVSFSFAASTSKNYITSHEVLAWSFNSSGVPKVTTLSHKRWLIPVLGVGGALTMLLVVCLLSKLWLVRRSHCTALRYCTGTRVFLYKELCKATKNFSESEKLGSGGFGTVYRGSFGSTFVAVKRINYESKYAERTFLAEISSLALIRHRNVVQLQGWCHEQGRLLLVYDYMPNGTLNDWLYGSGGKQDQRPILSWKLRHRILQEVAAALEYLHSDCVQCVLHRDIKSSNVLLDADFKAYLGDFGLARLMDHNKHDRSTTAAGTLGYMAPELPYTGRATKESDVYSFGILLLEVMCGKQPLDPRAEDPEDLLLLHSVWRAQETETLLAMADPRSFQTSPPSSYGIFHDGEPNASHSLDLRDDDMAIPIIDDDVIEVKKTIKNLLQLGLMCCLPKPKARPTMGQVMQILYQINDIDDVDCLITSMAPLPKTKPLGLYCTMEFSQTVEFVESTKYYCSENSKRDAEGARLPLNTPHLVSKDRNDNQSGEG